MSWVSIKAGSVHSLALALAPPLHGVNLDAMFFSELNRIEVLLNVQTPDEELEKRLARLEKMLLLEPRQTDSSVSRLDEIRRQADDLPSVQVFATTVRSLDDYWGIQLTLPEEDISFWIWFDFIRDEVAQTFPNGLKVRSSMTSAFQEIVWEQCGQPIEMIKLLHPAHRSWLMFSENHESALPGTILGKRITVRWGDSVWAVNGPRFVPGNRGYDLMNQGLLDAFGLTVDEFLEEEEGAAKSLLSASSNLVEVVERPAWEDPDAPLEVRAQPRPSCENEDNDTDPFYSDPVCRNVCTCCHYYQQEPSRGWPGGCYPNNGPMQMRDPEACAMLAGAVVLTGAGAAVTCLGGFVGSAAGDDSGASMGPCVGFGAAFLTTFLSLPDKCEYSVPAGPPIGGN